MFAALGRVVTRHPWRVIGVWIVAAFLIIAFSPRLTATTDEAAFLPSHYESIQAQTIQERAFPAAAAPAAIIVVERSDGQPLTGADSQRVQTLATTLVSRH